MHPEQERCGLVRRGALGQHEPGPDRLAVLRGGGDLLEPARQRDRDAGAVERAGFSGDAVLGSTSQDLTG